jgi:hypothetical protein
MGVVWCIVVVAEVEVQWRLWWMCEVEVGGVEA